MKIRLGTKQKNYGHKITLRGTLLKKLGTLQNKSGTNNN